MINIVLVILGVIAGVFILVSGAMGIYPLHSINQVVLCLYFILIGLAVIVLEIAMPAAWVSWLGFYSRWAGKGAFFIFFGFLILGPAGYGLVAGIYVIVLGAVFIVLHFINKVPPPVPLTRRNEVSSGGAGGNYQRYNDQPASGGAYQATSPRK
eukprot:TRINITY_DN3248_c0_g1_i3.p1 TRINITY_DN3248_c0_g1~~TRINITY_DN3248_c0_g1_i3.p1  ORF type:complete len:154 (-),score=32.90 TRINITY_DN3248_c0_g1_i3:63-524(-)